MSNCVTCPPIPACNCAQEQRCEVLSQSCAACGTVTCVALNSSSSAGGGVSKAALAGAIVGILLVLAAVLAFIWFCHKRNVARRLLLSKMLEPKPEVPAAAEDVLRRPDPVEKPNSPDAGNLRIFSGNSNATINLDPQTNDLRNSTRDESLQNPFVDTLSTGSVSDRSHSNVIPVSHVPYGSVQAPSPLQSQDENHRRNAVSPIPTRPLRSPDLNLRLENASEAQGNLPALYDLAHVNVSNDSVPKLVDDGSNSMRSAGSRASYLTTGTYATDLFTESPTIITRQQGKIVGLTKAQVVEVPASSSNGGSPLASSHLSPSFPRLSRVTTTRSIRSPLAQSAFTAEDILELDEQQENSPFADINARSDSSNVDDQFSTRSGGTFGTGRHWVDGDANSVASGVEARITTAQRIVVGTPGRLLTPASTTASSKSSVDTDRRRLSYVSEASSRADSILESFPFVPPTPLSISSFRSGARGVQTPRSTDSSPPSVSSQQASLEPPDRRMLAMSTFSQASNTSTGLGAFPFEFQLDANARSQPQLPVRDARASLDTLALSRDVTAYALAYDGDSNDNSGRNKHAKTSATQR